MELLNETSVIVDSGTEHPDKRSPITFKQVTFSYPSRPDQPALTDFELSIHPGKSLALVGQSGAGKSTLFELLQRFYDPQQGSISYGEYDLRQIPLAAWRERAALVPQSPVLFSGSVRYNIAYGKPDASDAEIQSAAQTAYAHDFISQLPEGYDSPLGAQGVRLSGGQRQRIAIARAVLKNPEILLLDEATSALDTESEFYVQQALSEIMHDRTTIIIAHRLSTIINADNIAVIDQGRVVATGTHSELLSTSPLYARLASLQFDQESR